MEKALPKDDLKINPKTSLAFFHLVVQLKKIKREGWRRYGIENGESVADHSQRMAMMAFLAPPELDLGKCVMMSLVHDIAETVVGDLTPTSGVTKEERHRRESLTVKHITEHLESRGEIIRDLLREFEARKTPESLFVQDIDKLEMLLQAIEYEEQEKGNIDLGDFAGVATKIQTEKGKNWAKEILETRKEYWGKRKHKQGELGEKGGISKEFEQMQHDYYEGRS
ncbi:hypothetical protein LY76DRAFT_688438 [Colletotrichum caudatum]|nr:hypothetical protein LY76DRAFT_688438 [Colletotrichum caudatum]